MAMSPTANDLNLLRLKALATMMPPTDSKVKMDTLSRVVSRVVNRVATVSIQLRVIKLS